ncbi:hypothetical protein GQ55_9G478700 [Panicum hallii var. hallii]|uniref:Uncharacterized protein n=1 Tax=Panicum hallii var. hallii TaxID=1504633 RepID=A0A2T7CCQ7_9POAL|nr:hypothetical protein GQ55_9G478700 [Panicum hallii var. hallii]
MRRGRVKRRDAGPHGTGSEDGSGTQAAYVALYRDVRRQALGTVDERATCRGQGHWVRASTPRRSSAMCSVITGGMEETAEAGRQWGGGAGIRQLAKPPIGRASAAGYGESAETTAVRVWTRTRSGGQVVMARPGTRRRPRAPCMHLLRRRPPRTRLCDGPEAADGSGLGFGAGDRPDRAGSSELRAVADDRAHLRRHTGWFVHYSLCLDVITGLSKTSTGCVAIVPVL